MDLNNIEKRLSRLNSAVNAQMNFSVQENIQVKNTHLGGKRWSLEITPDAKQDDQMNNVLSIMKDIYSLKEHAKRKISDKDSIEDEIKKSKYILIAIDLHNADKHGYPLDKPSHSKLDPKIENFYSYISSPQVGNVSFEFGIGSNTGEFKSGDQCMVSYSCDIVDSKGQKIMELDELVDGAINGWERIMKKHKLI